jgi:hypothetical protein
MAFLLNLIKRTQIDPKIIVGIQTDGQTNIRTDRQNGNLVSLTLFLRKSEQAKLKGRRNVNKKKKE